jgi:C-terminal processing protease CtpA/Prc
MLRWGSGFAVGVIVGLSAQVQDPYEALGDVSAVYGTALNEHIDRPDPTRLARAAIDGMLAELDPWSRRTPTDRDAAPPPAPLNCSVERGALVVTIRRFAVGLADRYLAHCPELKMGRPLLIDLRGNPGGSLQAAISFADLLVAEGDLLVELDRNGRVKSHQAHPAVLTVPAIDILIDERTASAAELLAAVLRHRAGARVLGSPSRGKSTIQRTLFLSSGDVALISTGAFALPAAQPKPLTRIVPEGPEPKDPVGNLCARVTGSTCTGAERLSEPPVSR